MNRIIKSIETRIILSKRIKPSLVDTRIKLAEEFTNWIKQNGTLSLLIDNKKQLLNPEEHPKNTKNDLIRKTLFWNSTNMSSQHGKIIVVPIDARVVVKIKLNQIVPSKFINKGFYVQQILTGFQEKW